MNATLIRLQLAAISIATLLSIFKAGGGTLYFDTSSGASAITAVSLLNQPSYTFGNASPLGTPAGLAVDTNGFLYAAYTASNIIVRYTPTGQSVYTAADTNGPLCLAFDSFGNLYSGNFDNSVSVISPSGLVSNFVSLSGRPLGMSFATNGSLYVVEFGGDGPLCKIAPDGTITTLSNAPGNYLGDQVVIDSRGDLLVATVTNQGTSTFQLTELDPFGNFITNLVVYAGSDEPHAAGPAIDAQDNLYLSTQTSRNFGITSEITENGSVQTISSLFAFQGGYLVYSPFDSMLSDLPATPTIIRQPQSQTVGIGGTANFGVFAEVAPFWYQWYFNLTNVIQGATNSGLILTNVQLEQAGIYTVVISNTVGSVTSAPASLNALPALNVNLAPLITLHGGVGLT